MRRSSRCLSIGKVMAEHLNEWMKYWDANIRNSGRKK